MEKTKKPWGGRFKEATAESVERFTESISFDSRLWPYDIEGSIAHAKMLSKCRIIPKNEAEKIISALKEIAREIESGLFHFDPSLEDIHMNIEASLIKKIGPLGGKLHTARSRNDQIALDLRLYLREEIKNILSLIKKLRRCLLDIAQKNIDIIMPGYTHLQKAQPVLLSHHLLAYVEMLGRDSERLRDALKRVNILPLGSCALAGTGLGTDRKYIAKILGFDSVSQNSMDAVSDRDFVIEFLSASAMIMMHLSRLSEEIVLWSTEEFSFIEIPDSFATGSSIMPQKKNPDVAELIRGKTGRIYGGLISVLTLMKGLPLTYNRDLQEDKPPLFDSVDTLKAALGVLIEMMPKIRFNKRRLRDSSMGSYTTATDMAEYLVRRGLPFRDAHEIVGRIVLYAIKNQKRLDELSTGELKEFSPLFEKDIYRYLTPEGSVMAKTSEGGTSPKEVRRQIARLKKSL